MERLTDNKLEQAKLYFYQLLVSGESYTYREILALVTERLKNLLQAESVALYVFDFWQKRLERVSYAGPTQSGFYRSIDFPFAAPCIPNQLREFPHALDIVLPLQEHGEAAIGYLYIGNAADQLLDNRELAGEIRKFVSHLTQLKESKENEQHINQLYEATTNLHASIDMHDVLTVLINTLQQSYPQFAYALLLAQDYHGDTNLPIKNLVYDYSVHEASAKAYMTGEVQVDRSADGQVINRYVPLHGKQGIYGVLHVSMPAFVTYTSADDSFITKLADSAGNALENARLYQHSKKLISDLQLINETSKKINANLRLSDTITLMHEQIHDTFGGEEIGFILYKGDQEAGTVLDGSTGFFFDPASAPFLDLIARLYRNESKEAMFVSNFPNRYPEINLPYRSLLVVPMAGPEQLQGVVLVLHRNPSFFTFESFRLIESLVQHSSLSIVNSMLQEKLERLVITDYLTNLCSRSYLDDRMRTHIQDDAQGGFILIDVDDFKKVNDTYGHNTGDYLLIQVANLLKDLLGPNDVAARWGGEELAVYMPHATFEQTIKKAEEIVESVASSTRPAVTVSCGISTWTEKARPEVHELFSQADYKLYDAKRLGKNRYCV
ncbi:diguanylate cyclase (GGDEF) domain-containing protein [Terribacillus aidingensis]|uniref:Diguanylate cyclase (GGDEF) domain-containing protein n=1 Tax=Terribacillus aidingensis TaxID=586416 RepID=A0A285P8M7_9BACI|nr:sensor domain-containing diguanylate cyclase [Terribacillus aidingensis]SNZ18090.1 diguanylate cyclase (GGDEF) domain-containing protein [Terribacillus aidingensis]